jgi:hypothetical protein
MIQKTSAMGRKEKEDANPFPFNRLFSIKLTLSTSSPLFFPLPFHHL